MLTQSDLEKFERDGYLVIENFITKEKCADLMKECDRLIESNNFMDEVSKIPIFHGDNDETKLADMYFLTSTDKIRPFLEKKATDILNESKENISSEKKVNKQIFNKIGHALHALNPAFREITFSDKVKDIVRSLEVKKPIVCQSMYIFKQPYIGGEVQIHQDGSYLHTDPLKIFGIWIALEDCTTENGCLSFLPGSQSTPLSRRFIRNPNKEEFDAGKYLVYVDVDPVEYDESKFVTAEVKAGSAVLIHGLTVHRSGANFSPKSRNIYTFHLYESENTTFSKDNWMEYSPVSFLPLYETK